MADTSKSKPAQPETNTVELPSGTKVTTGTGKKPGPDVSNADINLQAVSADAAFSSYHTNPDPNPDNLRPAPGPSTIQVLGTPEKDADPSNPFEETR